MLTGSGRRAVGLPGSTVLSSVTMRSRSLAVAVLSMLWCWLRCPLRWSRQEPSPGDAVEKPAAAEAMAAFVPVLRFWTPRREITLEQVRAAIEGRSDDYRRVLVAADDPDDPVGDARGGAGRDDEARRPSTRIRASRRVLRKAVLGLLPASEVRPDVRALSVDGLRLFGRTTWTT